MFENGRTVPQWNAGNGESALGVNVRMCPCCLSLSVEPIRLFLEWYFKQQMFWVLKQVGFEVCTHTHTHNELLVVRRWVFFYNLWWYTEKERRKNTKRSCTSGRNAPYDGTLRGPAVWRTGTRRTHVLQYRYRYEFRM